MRESKIEKEVCKYAEKLGWLVFKFISPGLRGVPDRFFLRNGKIVFIEFKAPDKEPSKIQWKRIGEIRKQNFYVGIVDSIEQGKQLFNLFEG